MTMTSTIARHPEREAIEAAIVAGQSNRTIAEQFGVTASAVLRHRGKLAGAVAGAEVDRTLALRERIEELETDARRLGKRAEAGDDLRTALAAVRERARLLELSIKITESIELEERLGALEAAVTQLAETATSNRGNGQWGRGSEA